MNTQPRSVTNGSTAHGHDQDCYIFSSYTSNVFGGLQANIIKNHYRCTAVFCSVICSSPRTRDEVLGFSTNTQRLPVRLQKSLTFQ